MRGKAGTSQVRVPALPSSDSTSMPASVVAVSPVLARHRGELGLLFQALQVSLEGNTPLAQSSLQRLRDADPGNAYYRWIAPSAP
jgi:hypothetical protein